MQQFAPRMSALTIKREGSLHHQTVIDHHHFASGTSIRRSLMNDNEDWKNVVPNQIQSLYCTPHTTVEDTFYQTPPLLHSQKRAFILYTQ